jgi:fibronectin-binding autotransporter adhesin
MSGSTISSKITHGITLGSGGYNSPLTVTSSGGIKGGPTGADGVYSSLSSGAIYNSGVIHGGAAVNFRSLAGAGVSITGGVSLINAGRITGGYGGYGAGVVTTSYVDNLNSGVITGGSGGHDRNGSDGVVLNGGTLVNAGTVIGGADNNYSAYGASGVGVSGAGYLNNSGTIIGGNGYLDNYRLNAGDAVDLNGTVVNSGLITGAGSTHSGFNNLGGIGVRLNGGVLDNSGTITGGNGIIGAPGVYLVTRGTVINSGFIGASPADNVGVQLNAGGLVINSGTIEGTPPFNDSSPAVALAFGSGNATLVVEPGSRFIGEVEASTFYQNTLSVAEYATVTGVGSQYTGFQNIAFGGYEATVVGGVPGLAAGEHITGFVAGDVIALGGFTATGAALTSTGVELFAGGNSLAVNLKGPGAANIEVSGITLVSGAVVGTSIEALSFGGGLFAGQIELVGAGGSAYAPFINAGGRATIYAGGTVVVPHIQGGLLDVKAGATISQEVIFSGTGTLEIDGTVAPQNLITGFGAGDTIQLTSLPYKAGATASVSSPGHVVIHDGAATVKLNIAGTTLGESLVFGPGSVLTVGTAQMAFMAPETVAREGWFSGGVMVETPVAAPVSVSSAVRFGGGPDLVGMVHKGGVQSFIVMPHG